MTKIEWTDKTQNPIKEGKIVPGPDGCELPPEIEEDGNCCIPISSGCKYCYASVLNAAGTRFGGNGRKFGVRANGHPEMWLNGDMLQKWTNIRKPRRIFVGSMTDIFGEWVPEWMLFAMLDAMAESIATFQLLTKRPERMAEIVDKWLRLNMRGVLPSNIWVGTSAENQECYNSRMVWLGRAQAHTRFLSLEPLLGPIDSMQSPYRYTVDWIIIGGESGPNARPLDTRWVSDILAQCKAAKIPAFVKQLGTHWARGAQRSADSYAKGWGQSKVKCDPKGGEMAEWPAGLRVRMFPGGSW